MTQLVYTKDEVLDAVEKISKFFEKEKTPKPLAFAAMTLLNEMLKEEFKGLALTIPIVKKDELN